MKKWLLSICLICSLMMTPLYAHTTPTLTLNNMSYTPIHPTYTYHNISYISLDDLQALTYLSYQISDNKIYLNFNGDLITLSINSKKLYLNNDLLNMQAPVRFINDIIYIPITLLDTLNYNYTYDHSAFHFISPLPYSQTTDTYKDHTLVELPAGSLHTLTNSYLNSDEQTTKLLDTACTNHQYIMLPFTSSYEVLRTALKEDLKDSFPMEVAFREIDLLSQEAPTISQFKTTAITPLLDDNGLILKIDDTTLRTTCFEAAFNPDDELTPIDSTKTIDAMVMRLLYQYVRDNYNFKDDAHFSEVSLINMARSDHMRFKVYFDDTLTGEKATYEIIISKQIQNSHLRYTVDFYNIKQ